MITLSDALEINYDRLYDGDRCALPELARLARAAGDPPAMLAVDALEAGFKTGLPSLEAWRALEWAVCAHREVTA